MKRGSGRRSRRRSYKRHPRRYRRRRSRSHSRRRGRGLLYGMGLDKTGSALEHTQELIRHEPEPEIKYYREPVELPQIEGGLDSYVMQDL